MEYMILFPFIGQFLNVIHTLNVCCNECTHIQYLVHVTTVTRRIKINDLFSQDFALYIQMIKGYDKVVSSYVEINLYTTMHSICYDLSCPLQICEQS